MTTKALTAEEVATACRYHPYALLINGLVLLLCSLVVFRNNSMLTFFGYDGAFYRTLIRNQHQWLTPSPDLGADPLEGLGNQFFLINTQCNPSDVLGTLLNDDEARAVLTFVVIAFELFAAVVFLAWCWRLPRALAILTAWLVVLVSLPYTSPTMLYPIARGGPQRFELLAATLVMMGLFHRLGQGTRWRSALEIVVLSALVLWLFISPLLGITMFPILAVTCLMELATSRGRERGVKALGVLAMASCALSGPVPFLLGSFLYTVPSFFGPELQPEEQSLRTISVLFQFGFNDGYFGPFLVVGAAAGAVCAWFAPPVGPRRVILLGPVADLVLIGLGLMVVYGLPRHAGPMPLYFEVTLWPFLCLSLGHGLLTLLKTPWPLIIVPVLLSPLCFENLPSLAFDPFRYPPTATPLVRELAQQIALEPGSKFQGSVATFTGLVPGGGQWVDIYANDLMTSVATGNEHRAFGLWYYNVPTLHEYNQFMTPTFYLTTTRLLARPEDRQRRSVVMLTRPDIPYLRSLGVRYMITDFEYAERSVELKRRMEVGTQGSLFLYELPGPNLGTFSPTTLHVAASAAEALARLARPGFSYETEAVAAEPLFTDGTEPALVPASAVELRMQRDRVEIDAASAGTSLLLLPLQYSRCLLCSPRPGAAHGAAPRLVRLNLMQAGLLFSASASVDIRFACGPFTHPYGRIADYLDARHLRLSETQRPAPPARGK